MKIRQGIGWHTTIGLVQAGAGFPQQGKCRRPWGSARLLDVELCLSESKV